MKRQDSHIFFGSPNLPPRTTSDRVSTPVMSNELSRESDPLKRGFRNQMQLGCSQIAHLQEQFKANSRHDLHLWTIVITMLVILAVGLAGILAPALVWHTVIVHINLKYLPQLFWGLIALIALFSIYVTSQKRALNVTRNTLLQEFLVSEHLRAFSLLDPVTQLLNSFAIENISSREIARANRSGFPLAFAVIGLDNFSGVQGPLSAEQSEHGLFCAAQLLKNTFRGSDAIFRNGPAEFLVVMPDTTEQQADAALSRLKSAAEQWNAETDGDLELSFSYGIAAHVTGATSTDSIEQAHRRMFLSSQKLNLVF